ncbi:hypothetical protein [Acholeplasma hippikon]|uniref:Uncharacterized protein n=1 Tax=Acholeplasma hippikon TaxID=264636 RepID=A0A449BJX6_9MOLU|nr:hypothetical protein [Acholeplasma hippikon]VEU82775.1 Uncharacterised protein [Acholeplasma hippikon]
MYQSTGFWYQFKVIFVSLPTKVKPSPDDTEISIFMERINEFDINLIMRLAKDTENGLMINMKCDIVSDPKGKHFTNLYDSAKINKYNHITPVTEMHYNQNDYVSIIWIGNLFYDAHNQPITTQLQVYYLVD